MSKPILSDTKDRQRIEAMARVFTKADRVLSGDPIDVVVEDGAGMPAPSWTDGRTITFNQSMIGNVTTVEDIIRLTGLNYHELAHVLYTPRSGSKLVTAIRTEGLQNSFNILEDQRIETFLTSIYPSTVPYLVSTFLRFCIQSDGAWKTNFVLMHGRRYLPSDVRSEFRRRFIRQDLIPQFESIINEYRKLVYPVDSDRGLELTREFDRLLGEMGSSVQDPHGHSSQQRPDINAGRPAPQREQRDASDVVDDADEAREQEEEERKAAQDQDSDSDSDEIDDDSQDSGDGDTSDDSGENGSEKHQGTGNINGDEHGNEEGSPNSNGFGGSGSSSDDEALTSEQLRELMNDIAKQHEQSDNVQEDVANKQRSIVQSDEGLDSGLGGKRYSESYAYPEDIATVRRFATVLERLSSDADPGWSSHASSGRVSMRRVMEGADYDQIWDRWEEGNNDATDIECVINIDTSGSMSYIINQASRALWVIKRALETLDANVTVISYGNDTRVVYQRGERASRTTYKTMAANGSTYARKAVEESVRILESSNRTNKIFITITDGQWNQELSGYGHKTSDELIAALNNIGVTTALAYIGYPYFSERHNCQIYSAVNNPIDLIDFAKKIVTQTFSPRKVA